MYRETNVNKSELVTRLAMRSGLTKTKARQVVEALFGSNGIIADRLRAGERVTITGFGTFGVAQRRGRVGRNPRTGAPLVIKPSVTVRFAPARGLKDAIPHGASGEETSGPRTGLLLGGESSEDVALSAYHPTSIAAQHWYKLLVYAHVPESLNDVQADSRARLRGEPGGYKRGKGSATSVIRRGAEMVVVPELPGCRFNPPKAGFVWLRDWHRAEFELQATPDAPGFEEDHAVNGRVAFYVGPVLVGEVRVWTHIAGPDDVLPTTPSVEATQGSPYRRIFVSYSRCDTKVVEGLERAYTALGDTYLRDVRALRSGKQWNPALLRMIEAADIFQLCWSMAAKESPNVEQEWRHALAQERIDPFIRPTYWEKPMPTPPNELKGLHFAPLELNP